MTDKKIIDRVRKLRALGESTNQHEAELAISRANELMEKHQLSLTDVEVRDIDKSQIIKEDYVVDGQKMKLHWVENLAFGVAKLFDGTILVNKVLHGTSFTFVGFPDDVALMKVLFGNLYKSWGLMILDDLNHAKADHKEQYNGYLSWSPSDTMKFKQGHGIAYANIIFDRCVEAARLRNNTVSGTNNTGTALVLSKKTALKDFGAMDGWTKGKARKTSAGSYQGKLSGQAAGRKAQISQSLGS
jgi:hypothetical protein